MALELKEWIEFVKQEAKAVFTRNRLNEIHYRFLTKSISPYNDYDVRVINIGEIFWVGDEVIKELTGEYDTHNFQSDFEIICKLQFKSKKDNSIQEIEYKFQLTC